ncbi:helix-turn-helix domain-containing protein [Hoeflea sp.]|uniref:helix-turn-helix domain-containing protein n=1 Tax=Hoeflea sp. TaxID=1940281 RepID=UPI003A8E02B3
MSFAANLKKHRIRKGFSLQKLADQIGVSKAHIWDLETLRATNPSLEVLQKLSSTLDVPIASLVGESPDSEDGGDEAVVMYRDLKTLEPEDRETIKLMMERLKRRPKD